MACKLQSSQHARCTPIETLSLLLLDGCRKNACHGGGPVAEECWPRGLEPADPCPNTEASHLYPFPDCFRPGTTNVQGGIWYWEKEHLGMRTTVFHLAKPQEVQFDLGRLDFSGSLHPNQCLSPVRIIEAQSSEASWLFIPLARFGFRCRMRPRM